LKLNIIKISKIGEEYSRSSENKRIIVKELYFIKEKKKDYI
jgi:hypothetical protein